VGECEFVYTFTCETNNGIIVATFIGKYDARLDVKGRVFIPSAYRKLLSGDEKDRLVMRRDVENECIVLFPESVWTRKVEDFKAKLDEWDPQDQLLLMQFVSDAEWLDVDAQGRILLSKKHLMSIGVDTLDVQFVGMVDRFAVWNPEKYEKSRLASSDFAQLIKSKMEQRV
jgi:MraZ protein